MASSASQLYVPMNMIEFGAGHLQHHNHQAILQDNGRIHSLEEQQIQHSSAQWNPQIPAFITTRPYNPSEPNFNDSHAVDIQTMSKMLAPSPSVMQLYEVATASVAIDPMTRAVPLLDYQPPCAPVSESTPAPSLYSPPPQFISPQPLYPSEQISANVLERRASYATSSYAASSPGVHSQATPPPLQLQPYDDTIPFNFVSTNWGDSNTFNWDPIPTQTAGTPELSFNEGSPGPEVVFPIPFDLDFSQVPEDQRPEFFDPSEYELVRLPCLPSISAVGHDQLQSQQEQQARSLSIGMASGMDNWYGASAESQGLGLGFAFDPLTGMPYYGGEYDKAQREADAIMATCVTFDDLKADGKKRKLQLMNLVAGGGGGGKVSKLNGPKRSLSASSTRGSSAPKPLVPPRTRRRSAAVAKRPTKAAATVQVA